MTEPVIRRATANDAAQIRDLTRAAYAKWVPLIGREPLPMTADYARAVEEHVIDLLERDGKLVALIEVIPATDHWMIENLAVDPTTQGKGHGDRLLVHVETRARENGIGELRLYTNEKFAANIAYYAKRGYREYKREELVPGNIAVHMRKQLSL